MGLPQHGKHVYPLYDDVPGDRRIAVHTDRAFGRSQGVHVVLAVGRSTDSRSSFRPIKNASQALEKPHTPKLKGHRARRARGPAAA